MNRPAARRSSLAGTSALTPPPLVQAAVAPAIEEPTQVTAVAPSAAPAPVTADEPKKAGSKRMNYYADDETAGRIRTAYLVGRSTHGWRSLTEFQLDTIMKRVEELEQEFNGGVPFQPSGAGSVSAGRPLD